MINMESPDSVPDVQASRDTREIPIQRVGIRDICYPVKIQTASGETQSSIARCSLYVNLSADQKGTHMSRFVELLAVVDEELSFTSFTALIADMVAKLEAEQGYIQLVFPYFVNKVAPVTGANSLLDYEVTLTGQQLDGASVVSFKVVVPVTSLCPCSKTISRYGAHNQRSHVTVEVEAKASFWIEDIISLVEQEASCELYALLKRADEQYITEKAYDNPKFVEDMVRDVAARLVRDDRVFRYRVECENFESIHNHSAYAMIESG